MSLNTVEVKLGKLKPNDELIVETEMEIYSGRLHYFDARNNFIKLNSVKDLKRNIAFTSTQLIPTERIRFIQIQNGVSSSESSSSGCFNSDVTNESSSSNEVEHVPNIVPSTIELKALQQRIAFVKVLIYRGPDFDDAFDDIKAQRLIAIDIEPHRCGRYRKAAIITVATPKSVYVFDLISLGRLFEDFKDLLKAERPYKIIYNSSLVADYFQYQHGTQINAISDVLIAYCIVTKTRRKNVKLEEMVKRFFGSCKDSFEDYNDSHVLFSRPLSKNVVENCAKRAAYIFQLNEYLQFLLLQPYFSQCKSFSRFYADCDDTEVVADSILNKDDMDDEYIQEPDINRSITALGEP